MRACLPCMCAALTLLLAAAPATMASTSTRTQRRTAHVAAALSDPFPNDPGAGGPGDWWQTQWNLLPDEGIDAPSGWRNLSFVGRPGASGITVAVLDSGVNGQAGKGLPTDFGPGRFVDGYDFVARRRHVSDPSGHGSVVAGIIGEDTDNGVGLAGIAYRAGIMPVRVLDVSGNGRASDVARGIRFAVRHRAAVLNLSFSFSPRTTRHDIPDVVAALAYARRRGAVIV